MAKKNLRPHKQAKGRSAEMLAESSGDFLPPSPLAEKANAGEDHTGEASTEHGAATARLRPRWRAQSAVRESPAPFGS
jgi:hypothetical protein